MSKRLFSLEDAKSTSTMVGTWYIPFLAGSTSENSRFIQRVRRKDHYYTKSLISGARSLLILDSMNGAQLMRGEPLGPPVPPRDIDRYPRDLVIDFRRCPVATLRKYCAKFDIENVQSLPPAELAGIVARHFKANNAVREEATLKTFTEFVLSYSGGNTLEDVKYRSARRFRKRTRRTAAGASSDNSDDEAQSEAEADIILYCVCNRPAFGGMVACDNADCNSGQWFHLSCVGLKEGQVPDNWFCPDCEKKQSSGDGSRRRRNATKKRLGES